jgi:hypothetical protein
MKIGRRRFIHAAALCACPAAPSFASPKPAWVTPPPSLATETPTVLFRIDGWEPYGVVSAGNPDPEPAWIGVSRSWRASWR